MSHMTTEPYLSNEEALRELVERLRFGTASEEDMARGADVVEALLIYKALAEKCIVKMFAGANE